MLKSICILQFSEKKTKNQKPGEINYIFKFTCISMDIFCKSTQEVGNIVIKEGNWSRLGGELFTKCPFEITKIENVLLKKEFLTKHSPELFILVTICFSY